MHLAKPGKSCARCFFTCTISRTDLPEDGRASRQLTQFASEPVTQESLCSDCRAFGTRESWCAGRATSPALVAALAIEAFKLFQQTVSHCFQGTQYWLGDKIHVSWAERRAQCVDTAQACQRLRS